MNQTSITKSVIPGLGDFSSRLVPLCDGRPGLRESLHTRAAPTGDATLDFVSSDETPDRWGEVISAAGWRLENYRRNPVFQNAHQYGDVIFTLGRALATEVREIEGRVALYQRIEFAVEANPMARIAYGLYRGGFLRAVSVGFIPLRWADAQGETGAGIRRRHLEQELLEVSAVSLPANPNALALAVKSGAVARGDLAEALDLVRALLDQPAPSLRSNGFEEHFLLARELREVLRRG